MTGRLKLLLPATSPSGSATYTVAEVDEDDEVVRNLFNDSLIATFQLTVPHWTVARQQAQAREWQSLQRSISADGTSGYEFRDGGGFEELPPSNSANRWRLLGRDLLGDKPNLKDVPALRFYCVRFQQSLVMLYGTVKTTNAWQDCEYAALAGHKSRAVAVSLDEAVKNRDLALSRDGYFDLQRSDYFEFNDNV